VDDRAEEIAKSFARLPTTQLRRFFGEAKGLKRQFDLLTSRDKGEGMLTEDEAWARIRPQFAMLKSKVIYVAGRQGKEIPPYFVQFVQFVVDHVSWVESHQDFEDFVTHFEAVVGFHRYLNEKG